MRLGEAIGLEHSNVGLRTGVVTIQARLDRERFVPLHPTATTALRRYTVDRDRLCPHPRCSRFFVSGTGTALDRSGVEKVFRHITATDGRDPHRNGAPEKIHDHLKLRAELNIIMLRPEPAGSIVQIGGDIDNRLKTLFDALRLPANEQEVPDSWQPAEDEQPLHCLLEDDRLIAKVTVETDRYLAPPGATHVRLVIGVRVWTPSPTWGSIAILG